MHGNIDRPEAPGRFREWRVSGMDCGSCATKVERDVARLAGVAEPSVALVSGRLRLRLDETRTSPAEVEACVTALGYGIHAEAPPAAASDRARQPVEAAAGPDRAPVDAPAAVEPGAPWQRTAKGRLALPSGALLALAWGVEALAPAGLGRWAFAAACLVGLAPVAWRAAAALRAGQPFTIESLMTMAALGALAIDAVSEAAVVVFLFAVGELLEGVAAGRARDGIRALTRLVPRTALVEEDGSPREVAAASVGVGRIVRVRPGERIPCDGRILGGVAGIDESPVTGESLPRTRGPGDPVLAGSICTDAALRIEATRPAEDNTIARIVRLVEEAEHARAPTSRLIDRFSRWYMPAVTALAVLVAVLPPLARGEPWSAWIYRGLALLLIGCPCALVISVPAAIAAALSAGARQGILVKGGAVLEAAAAVRTVAFDKTGTLTRGRSELVDVVPLAAADASEVLRLAAAVEAGSGHPLAAATRRRAAGPEGPPAGEQRAIPGRGVEALVLGRRLVVGSPRLARERGALDASAEERIGALEEAGATVAVLVEDRTALGLLAFRDEPRADAAAAIRELRALGLRPVMLTGDNRRAARGVAAALGIELQAELLPEDKLDAVRALAGAGGLVMVGDGIDDAPALELASVGVAMGSGTDVALETADAAILRDRLRDVPALVRLARATVANICRNLALALGLKVLFLVTSILGVTGLWIAILADTGATVLVTSNALRLLSFRPERAP